MYIVIVYLPCFPCIMKQRVTVKQVLSPESNRISAEGSLLIMDVLAELESGELVNIEIQRIGYAFPGERPPVIPRT